MEVYNGSTNWYVLPVVFPDGSKQSVSISPGAFVRCAGVPGSVDDFDHTYSGVVRSDGSFVVVSGPSPSGLLLNGFGYGCILAGAILAVVWLRRGLTFRTED